MNKNIFILITFISSFFDSYSQYDQKFSYSELSKGSKIYNDIYSVEHDLKGITFVNKEGKYCSKYFDNLNLFGGFRSGLIIYKGKFWSNVKNTDLKNNEYEVYPFIEVVKELENIDQTYLDDYLYDTFGNNTIKKYEESKDFEEEFLNKFPLYGFARRGNKYAYITKFGELLTDFKFSRDDYGIYVFDTLHKTKKYVMLDSNGKELLRHEFPINWYKDKEFYGFYDLLTSNSIIYLNGFEYIENSELKDALNHTGFPLNCNIFSDGNYIYKLEKGKIKKRKSKGYYVVTNFCNNRAIAVKINKIGFGKQLYIVNEKGDIIKELAKEFIGHIENFDKFGQITVFSDNGAAVLDYNGNIVIPFCDYCEINPYNDGLYGVFQFEKNDSRREFCIEEKSGFFNQYGNKIIPVTHYYQDTKIRFLEGINYNYLMHYETIRYILDKENNLIFK